jgi:two-component system cell cycle sensor histidine kinase/response regulator CckA
VVLDLTIQGGMGGKDAMDQLLAINPNVKAIVSNGYAADPVMADYETYGFRGVIQKPFDFPDIGKILDSVLNP